MRVVLDTNVLLSAVFTRGVCEALLDLLLESGAVEIVLSELVLREFRDHGVKTFGAPRADVDRAVAFLRRHAEVVEPISLPADVCRDPDDRPALGTALSGDVDALVTADGDLLELEEIQGVSVLSPRAIYRRLP